MRKIFAIVMMFLASSAGALAQFTYGDHPVLSLGYDLSIGTGLQVNVARGMVNCGSAGIVTYPGGALTLSADVTTYIFLSPGNSCGLSTNNSGFPSAAIPIGVVTTGDTNIIAPLADYRGIMTLASIPVNNGLGNGTTYVDVTAPPYNASNSCASDATSAINSAIAEVIAAGGTAGGTIIIPAGCYTIGSVTTDSYSTHALLVNQGSHISLIGYGATLQYTVNTTANILELRGSQNCNVEGLKVTTTHAATGTGVNLIRPTVSFGYPTQKNVLHNLELTNLAVAVQDGNNDNNQVSENTFDDLNIVVPSSGQGVVQRGGSNFNDDYRNITVYGPASASAILFHLYNGTGSCLRCTLELNGGNTGIQAESSYVGPFEFYSEYAEVTTDTDLFFNNLAPGGYFNFYGGNTSFFGTGGTLGAPITQFNVQTGGTFEFHHSNMYVPSGYKSFLINPSTPAIITRYVGFWSAGMEYFGNTTNTNLLFYTTNDIQNIDDVSFRCGSVISDHGSPTDLFIDTTPSCGGTPSSAFRFTTNYVQLEAGTFDPPGNELGQFGYAGNYFGEGYFSAFQTPSNGFYSFENNAGTGFVIGMLKNTSDVVQIGDVQGVKAAGNIAADASSSNGLILKSPGGTCYLVQVNNTPALTLTSTTCP